MASSEEDTADPPVLSPPPPPPPLRLPRSEASSSSPHDRRRCRILTVGDGDFSLSLALVRAYNVPLLQQQTPQNPIELTATTLVATPDELFRTYPQAAANVHELHERYGVSVVYGVDATQLHQEQNDDSSSLLLPNRKDRRYWDVVLFHHPHVGYHPQEDVQARNHERLLAHYLHSAAQVLRRGIQPNQQHSTEVERNAATFPSNGFVHLCLCGSQASTWRLFETAARLQLQPVPPHRQKSQTHNEPSSSFDGVRANDYHYGIPTARPFHEEANLPWAAGWQPVSPKSAWAAPRRFRNGKMGSPHWLSKYGYRHQRTYGTRRTVVAPGTSSASTTNTTTGDHDQDEDEDEEPQQNRPHSSSSIRSDGGLHFFFQPSSSTAVKAVCAPQLVSNDGENRHACVICGDVFETLEALQEHQQKPAIPPPFEASTEDHHQHSFVNDEKRFTNSTTQSSTDASRPNKPDQNDLTTTNTLPPPMRLRRFVQVHFQKTKAEANRLIQAGRVQLHGEVVTDTARFVVTTDTARRENDLSYPKRSNAESDVVVILDEAATATTDHPSAIDQPANSPPNQHAQEKDLATTENSVVAPSQRQDVQILEQWAILQAYVVWKPVSMRALGAFQGTLEHAFSHQQEPASPSKRLAYKCLTRLDTGCGGLCILQRDPQAETVGESESLTEQVTITSVQQEFTVLVHGRVPDSWMISRNENERGLVDMSTCEGGGIELDLPLDRTRSWKRKRGRQSMSPVDSSQSTTTMVASQPPTRVEEDTGSQIECPCEEKVALIDNKSNHNKIDQRGCAQEGATESSTVTSVTETQRLWVQCVERTVDRDGVPALSTLRIGVDGGNHSGIGSLLSHVLTQQGHRVVGDCKAKREYLTLPRAVRNRLKHKLCLGCTGVRAVMVRKSSSSASDQDPTVLVHRNASVPDKWSASFWQDFVIQGTSLATT